jgi:hypothetical protein
MFRKITFTILPVCFSAVLLSLASSTIYAQNNRFVGEWLLEFTSNVQGTSVQRGILAIELEEGELVAFLQNGPVPLAIEGDSITMVLDSRNSLGEALERHLSGALSGRQMTGEFGPPADTSEEELIVCTRFPGGCIHPSGNWTAAPYIPVRPDSLTPNPFDLSGSWGTTSGSGVLKWTSALTEQGQQWKDEYDVDLDLPSLRCANSGVFNLQRSAPEIFQQDHKLTFATGSRVRHVYMDGREPPEFYPPSGTGFSRGHWEGDHLIIETTHLNAGVRGYMGEVYSENSTMLERYWLNDDGTLSGEMELQDPENFSRPPLQRTLWARQSTDNVPYMRTCDVDSFFRQIYKDELMQEYIDRSDRRF